jgi:hypothetical protein
MHLVVRIAFLGLSLETAEWEDEAGVAAYQVVGTDVGPDA